MRQVISLCAAAVLALTAFGATQAAAADGQAVELALPPQAAADAAAQNTLSGKGVFHSEKDLDQARSRLREELRQSRAADNQAWATINSDRLDRELADRKLLARQSYARSGRTQMLERSLENTTVSSNDAKILSEWAREQKINDKRGATADDEKRKKMLDEYRKRYPSSEAAKAMQDWISSGSVSEERKEAREVMRNKRQQSRSK